MFGIHARPIPSILRDGDPLNRVSASTLPPSSAGVIGRAPALVRFPHTFRRPMEITWYGRACIRLKGRDATVITDPCPPATGFVAGKHDVELLTISHDHADHAYTRSITAGLTLPRPGEYEYSDVLINGVRTFHDGSRGAERGENIVFSIELD